MRALRALDLFCGAAGGWSVGLHANEIETVAACEIDPWRRERFSKNFPNAVIYEDVRSLTATRLCDDLGYLPEIIVGSPPCQDASCANAKGKGVDGERTGLFFEAVRLVREVRPDWACFENVHGLKSRGYDRVHDELEAAGYTVRPLVVGAWHAGAPHRRNRVWIIAVTTGEQMGRAGQSRREAERGDDADTARLGRGQRRSRGLNSSGARQPEQAFHDADTALVQRPTIARDQSDGFDASDVADASGADAAGRSSDGGRSGWQSSLAAWSDWNGGPPDLGAVDDGLPKGMARKMLSAYGDAVVPAVTGAVIRSILANG